MQPQRLTHQQRCILKMIAVQPYNAVDELLVLANGFDIDALAGLIRSGLVTASPTSLSPTPGAPHSIPGSPTHQIPATMPNHGYMDSPNGLDGGALTR